METIDPRVYTAADANKAASGGATHGNYSQADANRMQNQITFIVREMAQQLKDSGTPDLNKVKTTLTAGDTAVFGISVWF